MAKDNLQKYRSKRNLKKTKEPYDGKNTTKNNNLYVIQKHDASRLHYDFRISVNGVLKSWAIPKGPSTDKSEKRLAISTEDHPMEYADFEGVIPEGEYGAGKVLVWDKGSYKNITEKDGGIRSIEESIEKGHFMIELNGEKLKGGYAMTRMKKGDDESWLLVKMDDDHADARRKPLKTEPESVKSGKTLDDIK